MFDKLQDRLKTHLSDFLIEVDEAFVEHRNMTLQRLEKDKGALAVDIETLTRDRASLYTQKTTDTQELNKVRNDLTQVENSVIAKRKELADLAVAISDAKDLMATAERTKEGFRIREDAITAKEQVLANREKVILDREENLREMYQRINK